MNDKDEEENQNLVNVEKLQIKESQIDNEVDNIIEKVSLNITHFNLFLLLMIFCTVDGYTMISNSLIIPEIEKSWEISKSEKSFMGGSIFLGFMAGAALSGLVTFKGRQLGFQIGLVTALIGSYFSIYSSSAFGIILNNIILGIGYGICLPSGFSLVAEICNSKMRSYFLTYVWLLFPLGEILACLIAEKNKIFLYKTENWRTVYYYRFIGILIVLPFTFLMKESPKYMFTTRRNDEGFELLKNLMGSDHPIQLDENRKLLIMDQYDNYLKENEVKETASFKTYIRFYLEFFNKKNIFLSFLIFLLWFIVSFLYYGFIYVAPLILEYLEMNKKDSKSISEEKFDHIMNSIIISCVFEIPTTIIAGIIPNLESMGRKGTLIFGYIFTALVAFLMYLYPNRLDILSCFYKSVISFPFNTILIYTSEAFPTHLKVTALGLSNFFCRFGGFTNPFIIELLFKINPLMPFLGLSILGALGFVISMMLPYETLGRKIF
jgi:putative MFS transporter